MVLDIMVPRMNGIDGALIGRIFEPFYGVDQTRNRDSGGLGLGVAIAASKSGPCCR